jgi:hypothetical protein
MRRKTLDALLTAGGIAISTVLLIAGALLMWGHTFVNNEVHTQLAAQKIFFPAAGSESLTDPQVGPYLNKYAGQQLVNGAQAQAYADHFIAVHVQKVADGQTYAQLSSKAQANPSDTKLAGQVQTIFRGETLRGLLLNAYAFWKIGQIALYAAVTAFAGAAIFLLLSALGFLHMRRVNPDVEALSKLGAHTPAPVEP